LSNLKTSARGVRFLTSQLLNPSIRSDLFLRELHFHPERVGEAVGKVGEAREQVNVDDFRFGEMLAQRREVAVGDVVRRACQFFDIDQRGTFFFAVAGVICSPQRRPVFPVSPPVLTTRRDAGCSSGIR